MRSAAPIHSCSRVPVNLIEELKRRRIVRVAAVYGAVVFAVLQGADVLIPALRLPDWIITALAAMAVLGLPVAVGLAWAFERPDDAGGASGQKAAGAADTTGTTGWLSARTLAVVLGIVAVGLLAGWYARYAPGSTRYEALAVDAFPVRFAHVPDSTHFIDFRCCGPLFTVSRDGRRFAYTGGTEAARPVFVRELDELTARAVPGTDGGASLFFSPDGGWLGFEASGRLLRVDLGGGAPELITDGLPSSLIMSRPVAGATWTDDDYVVYATTADTAGLFEVPATGGTPRRLTSATGPEYHSSPAAVPGTSLVLFTIVPSDPRIGLVDRRTGAVRELGAGLHPRYSAGHLVSLQMNGTVVAEPLDRRSGRIFGPRHTLFTGVYRALGGWGDYGASATGTVVAQTEEIVPELVLERRDGLRRSMVLPLSGYSHLDSPRFSPDGGRVAVAAPREAEGGRHAVYVLDLASGGLLKISGDVSAEQSDWTTDGRELVMATNDASIERIPADLSGPSRVVVSPGDAGIGKLSVWTDWVAYTVYDADTVDAGTAGAGRGPIMDIFLARLDSTDATRPYLATPAAEYAPDISPDGRWVAYVSEASGQPEVYVSAFPESGGRVAVSTGGGLEPVWSGEAGRLYYRTRLGVVIEVTLQEQDGRLGVRGRTPVMSGYYEQSLQAADWDVAPGGDMFALLGVRRGGRLEIVVNALRPPE